ncbi:MULTISPECIES: hypothetical protein [unclassified Streptomyces]|uniref:hypothetical protein n=1 Tax=unclassified Streptomyces TaxID=2593676 RepID=UPI0003804FB0|nr:MULTISPECIES: hypothetical protein [unclassified Streptomyces]MYT32780.1 hypothetical protein [Streptomyces sp. SID8354]
MRTALTAAALVCSAAFLGSAGTAVADDEWGGVMNASTMNFQDVNNDNAGNRWAFGDDGSDHGEHHGDQGKEGKGGKEAKDGKEAKGGGKEGKGHSEIAPEETQ